MHRLAYLLVALTGCDTVFGLERGSVDDFDEDVDGIGNADDRCPHLADESSIDLDGDGISVDCDPDDHDPGTMVRFYGFDGEVPAELAFEGAVETELPGTITFGAASGGLSTITVKGIVADNVLLDVGFEILGSAIDGGASTTYDELGVYSAHRSFTTNFPKERGDTCYFGTLEPRAEPLYLELNEDDASYGGKPATGRLTGSSGRFLMRRTSARVDCTVFRDGVGLIPAGFDVTDLAKVSGTVAVSTERVKVRLRYIYIAYQPLSLP